MSVTGFGIQQVRLSTCPLLSLALTTSSLHQLIAHPKGVNHLARLPYELLERVFDLAYAESKPSTPLCRAFLPFYRRAVFGSNLLTSADKLGALARIFARNIVLGRFVEKLDMDVVPAFEANRLAVILPLFFPFLPRLRTINLGASAATLSLVMTILTATASHLPRLHTLKIHSLDTYSDDVLLWRSIAAIPTLRNLEVWLGSLPDPEAAWWSGYSFPYLLPNITSLCFGTEQNYRSGRLFRLFPGLRELKLIEWERPNLLPVMLTGLPDPSRLVKLEVDGSGLADLGTAQPGPWSIERPLSRFNNLEFLAIEGAHSCTPTFFDVLRTLRRLSTLKLHEGVQVATEELREFVEGPRAHPSLADLTLDIVDGQFGDSLHDSEPSLNVHTGFYELEGWELPKWTHGFSYGGMCEVKRACRRRNIQLSGLARLALLVQEEYLEEQELLVEWYVDYDYRTECESEEDYDWDDFGG
ncbi:hypothetical protein JCM8097_001091 [Rhodosporidiobolus ruineniae]